VEQYAYFVLQSDTMSAVDMTARLGIEPDEVMIRGYRRSGPRPLPRSHAWALSCRQPDLRIDDQVAAIIDRLLPHVARIEALAAELSLDGPGAAALRIVRYFGTGGYDDYDPPTSLVGSSDLLGWALEPDVIAFLHRTGAVIDVDEYA
jgi:hypothetical protein